MNAADDASRHLIELAMAEAQQAKMTAFAIALVDKLGGTVELDEADIQRLASDPSLNIKIEKSIDGKRRLFELYHK